MHMRVGGGPNAQYPCVPGLLATRSVARNGWGAFKQRLAVERSDLMDYGQIEAPATEVLMAGAERWASETGWSSCLRRLSSSEVGRASPKVR